MGTYKEDYELVKSKTIDHFFEFFRVIIKRINTEKVAPIGGYSSSSFPENHDLKDAITEIIMDEPEGTIKFKLLVKEVLCVYYIYPRARQETAKIQVYKKVLNYQGKELMNLEHMEGLDIVFGESVNQYPIIFGGVDYNRREIRIKDRTTTEYFDEYLRLLTDTIFGPEKSQT